MQEGLEDTIVACSTAPGRSAIAVIRISGSSALELYLKLLQRDWQPVSHRLRHTPLYDEQGMVLDDAMGVWMKGPRSFTGEDVVELHVHGAPVVVQSILRTLVNWGARHATAGEFTARAYRNGRLTLPQVEALQLLLQAETTGQATAAVLQLQRKHWYREWEHTYHQLNDWLAIWTAHIDFCEYTEIGQAPARAIEKSVVYRGLLRIQQALHEQMASAAVGHLGPQRVVFCGPPNAGKSTMINLLLGQDKILVSDIAGTTRDAVETAWHTEHGVLKLVDTAGLWEAPAGSLDADAVAITQRTLDEACQVVWLIPPGMTHIWPYVPRGAHIWASRADEWMASDIREDFIGRVKACGGIFQGWLSARSREGLSDFQEYLLQQLKTPAGIYLTDRQHQCLQKVLDSVAETLVCFEKELPEDMLQAALQPAHQAMGALLGYHTEQDMLDRLFSRFCIGK